MKNFKLETFTIDMEKAELMDFSETSNLNEMYKRFHQKLLNTINEISSEAMDRQKHIT